MATDDQNMMTRLAPAPMLAAIMILVGLYLATQDAVGPFILYIALLLILYPWWREKWTHGFIGVGTLFFLIWFVQMTAAVLLPFGIALLLAYLLYPFIDRLESRRVPRSAAIGLLVLLVLIITGLVILTIVPLLVDQIGTFIQDVPDITQQVRSWIENTLFPWLERFGLHASTETLPDALLGEGGGASQVVQRLLSGALDLTRGISVFLTQLANILLIPIITFYVLKDYHPISEWVMNFVPEKQRERFSGIGSQLGSALGNYLRGQLAVSLTIAVLYGTAFGIAGIQYALLLGLAAGILCIIPYIGSFLTILIAALIALLGPQPGGHLLRVVIIFLVVQFLDGNYITPKIMGDRFGMHPVLVLFAVLLSAALWGFVGLLIAVPLTAVLKVVADYLLERYYRSRFFETPATPPPEP